MQRNPNELWALKARGWLEIQELKSVAFCVLDEKLWKRLLVFWGLKTYSTTVSKALEEAVRLRRVRRIPKAICRRGSQNGAKSSITAFAEVIHRAATWK